MPVTGAPGFLSINLTTLLISANPIGKAPVATLGIASNEPLPGEISTSIPSALKKP